MNNDDNPDLERSIRDRIESFGQADKQIQGKPTTDEELQRLRLAEGRLDQWLADVTADERSQRRRAREEESESLRAAAARLDQLLTEIAGKEGVPELKRRNWPNGNPVK
jgi:hypothetical protein